MSRSLAAPADVGWDAAGASTSSERLTAFALARAAEILLLRFAHSRYFQEPCLLFCHESMAHLLSARAI